MITRNDDDRVEEAYSFFRLLYGKDAPGHIPIWTKQDKRTTWMPANDLREAARTEAQLAQDKDVYFGVGLQPEDLGPCHRGDTRALERDEDLRRFIGSNVTNTE